jgi:thymidylate kinase
VWAAILGPDGAGKSTVIEMTRERLVGEFPKITTFHFAPPPFGRAHPPTSAPHARPPRGLLPSVAKALYWALAFVSGYRLSVRPALARGEMVLFDRYLADAIVDPRRYRYGGPMWLLRILARICPAPDVVFLLDAPVGELLARKAEITPEEALRQRESYGRLVGEMRSGIIIRSAPVDDVVAQVEQVILSCARREATRQETAEA